jgi:hypothetical protein
VTGAGFGAAGAGAAGFGVTEATTGLAAAAGLRAGALRAAVFRAAGLRAALLAVLRAGFLADALRAGFLAVDFRAVLRALVFLALAPRRALLAVVFLLLVVRLFPLVLVAMASAPILLLLPHSTAQTDAYLHESRFHSSRLAVSHGKSIVFFIIALIATEKGNLPCSPTNVTRKFPLSMRLALPQPGRPIEAKKPRRFCGLVGGQGRRHLLVRLLEQH